ncbi:MAG: hypothetical protein H0W70_08605, partial [Actinobacteria bacterium]|nr:hypothetical protein [Actinomycetota bacterium]
MKSARSLASIVNKVGLTRQAVTVVLAACCASLVGASAKAAPATVAVEVDVAHPLGALNPDLVGLGWHVGGAPLAAVEPLAPHFIRIDASLQDVSVSKGAPLLLAPLLARIAAVRGIGAEPLVILSYVPAWLGAPNAAGRDPTRVKPADLDAWEQVVHGVVRALATAPKPARWFEAWNEPDDPLFWQDTPVAWVDTVERTGRAVAAVESETGLDLHFAGPATALPDPIFLMPFLQRFRDPALPLDAVSWHYYGNYPFFGPDGAEFPVTAPIQPVLGQENPLASPVAFGSQVGVMRSWVDAGLAGSGRPTPSLLLDEWNLSAAGFDHRHDTNEGAAFASGVLAEMQAAHLDASAFFRANDTQGVVGEHGIVKVGGARKPTWWTFWLWRQMAATEVAAVGGSRLDGLWVVATKDSARVTVVLSSFSASSPQARVIDLSLAGVSAPPIGATVRRIDAEHPSAELDEPLALDGARARVALPPQAVAFVTFRLAAAGVRATTVPRTDRVLPASGGGSLSPAIPLVA